MMEFLAMILGGALGCFATGYVFIRYWTRAVRHGLSGALVIGAGRRWVLGNLLCPECGAPVLLFIERVDQKTGIACEGGVNVDCLRNGTNHNYYLSDWQPVYREAEKFAREYLRLS